ncbi:MAG: shikimate kinase [Blautia sp.]|nr:shikimate kinase [Blautia sp.]
MEKRRNLFLIGFMGAGKSAAAKKLHTMYGYEVVEMDSEIEQSQGKSISGIFRDEGEAYFRRLETELLKSFSGKEGYVVSCGGGAAMREENVAEMKKNGKVVWLTASPGTIYERVKNSSSRPLLAGNMNVEYISGLMAEREEKYRNAADIVIDTDSRSLKEICEEIYETAG